MWWTVTVTSILALILGGLKVWLSRRQKIPPGSRLPPMPPTSSILGHVELLQGDFHRTKALEWTRQYGPVYRLRIYSTDVVVLNDIESVRKFSNEEELLYRSDCFLTGLSCKPGLGSLNGDVWRANKRFCMRMLRDMGFSKAEQETILKEECCKLADRLGELNGKPALIFPDVTACASNNVCCFFFGSTKPADDVWRKDMTGFLGKITAVTIKAGFFHFTPRILRRMFRYIPFTADGEIRNCMEGLHEIFSVQWEKYQAEAKGGSEGDFIHAYLKKIEEAKHDASPTFFHDDYLTGNITSLIVAGTFSTSLTIVAHLVNFAANKDTLQARVQREIDDVIGAQRLPTWEDRKEMPFTLACLWELERWWTTGAFGLPRLAADDIVVDGMFIPKNTVVLFNLWAVHYDPAHWEDPEVFKPSRYLNENGSIMKKPGELIPFSFGRRSCPGETFASIEIFFVITLLLQRYEVLLDKPLNGDLNSGKEPLAILGTTKLRFLPRNVNKV